MYNPEQVTNISKHNKNLTKRALWPVEKGIQKNDSRKSLLQKYKIDRCGQVETSAFYLRFFILSPFLGVWSKISWDNHQKLWRMLFFFIVQSHLRGIVIYSFVPRISTFLCGLEEAKYFERCAKWTGTINPLTFSCDFNVCRLSSVPCNTSF